MNKTKTVELDITPQCTLAQECVDQMHLGHLTSILSKFKTIMAFDLNLTNEEHCDELREQFRSWLAKEYDFSDIVAKRKLRVEDIEGLFGDISLSVATLLIHKISTADEAAADSNVGSSESLGEALDTLMGEFASSMRDIPLFVRYDER